MYVAVLYVIWKNTDRNKTDPEELLNDINISNTFNIYEQNSLYYKYLIKMLIITDSMFVSLTRVVISK